MSDDESPPIHDLADVPLGYEPIAEFEEEGEAVEHARASTELVMVVRQGRHFEIWAIRNHIWLS